MTTDTLRPPNPTKPLLKYFLPGRNHIPSFSELKSDVETLKIILQEVEDRDLVLGRLTEKEKEDVKELMKELDSTEKWLDDGSEERPVWRMRRKGSGSRGRSQVGERIGVLEWEVREARRKVWGMRGKG